MKKNGFVSTTLVYTFFVIFLLLMIFLLNNYSSNRFILENIRYEIKDSFATDDSADINLYIYIWNKTTREYELVDEVPNFGFTLNKTMSYCKNNSTLSYENGNLKVRAAKKDSCYAYFDEVEKDIVLNIYIKDSNSGTRTRVRNIPGLSYGLTYSSCTNGATISFDDATRKFKVSAKSKTVCEAEFTKREADVILHIFKQSAFGGTTYNNKKYTETKEVPGSGYSFNTYTCKNSSVQTEITYANGKLFVSSNGKNECNAYFTDGSNNIELIIMQEAESGEAGYTTGIKYVRTYTVPSTGYKYMGYICDNNAVSVTFRDGVLTAEGTRDGVCKAYFNKYNGSYYIHYLLEKTNGDYEEVAVPPTTGYVFNTEKSKCDNGGIIELNGGVVEVNTAEEDECYAYYDLINADIIVNVYVMDRSTSKYVLGDVPATGYELLSKNCTNDAVINYENGALKVTATKPTVCTVYFR